MIFRVVALTIGLIGSPVFCAAQPERASTAPGAQDAPSTFRRIFEEVMWNADGTNHEFELSDLPAAQFPLHIFEEGIELTPGVDYTMQGRVGVLAGKAIEFAGRHLQAAYMVASTSQEAPAADSHAGQSQANRLLGAYLRRSLNRELQQIGSYPSQSISPAVTTTVAVPARAPQEAQADPVLAATACSVAVRSPSPKGSAADPPSIRMLVNALHRSGRNLPAYSAGRESRSLDLSMADGLEGLGDTSALSPYQNLTLRPESAGDKESGVANARSSKAPTSQGTPASLRLLERSLARHDVQ